MVLEGIQGPRRRKRVCAHKALNAVQSPRILGAEPITNLAFDITQPLKKKKKKPFATT